MEISYDQKPSSWGRKQLSEVASNNLGKKKRKHKATTGEKRSRAFALGLTSSCAAAARLKHASEGSTQKRQTVEQQALKAKS